MYLTNISGLFSEVSTFSAMVENGDNSPWNDDSWTNLVPANGLKEGCVCRSSWVMTICKTNAHSNQKELNNQRTFHISMQLSVIKKVITGSANFAGHLCCTETIMLILSTVMLNYQWRWQRCFDGTVASENEVITGNLTGVLVIDWDCVWESKATVWKPSWSGSFPLATDPSEVDVGSTIAVAVWELCGSFGGLGLGPFAS